jgi:hypothetical protein
MKKSMVAFSLATVALAFLFPAYGKSPVKLSTVAPVADLVAEAEAKVELIEGYLKDEKTYSGMKKKKIPQAASVLACLGQAIAEHPQKSDVKAAGADLRDASLGIIKSTSYQEARDTFGRIKLALAGQSNGEAKTEHNWHQLIDLHRLMDEVNARNSKVRRVVRRSRDPRKDSLHATTLAVLALAIHADTHMVKDEKDIPRWQELSLDFQKSMTTIASALKEKDKDGAREAYLKAKQSCNHCHDAFRDK